MFNLYSLKYDSSNGRNRREPYGDRVDYYGVFCPDNNTCYLVPSKGLGRNLCSLRITLAVNRQVKKVRWAATYEMRA